MTDSFRLGNSGGEARELKQEEEGGLVPRFLGLDCLASTWGPAHWVAISNPLGNVAQPLFTLDRIGRKADLKSVARRLRKHEVKEAVVGNPLHMSGDQSPQAAKAQAFCPRAADGACDNHAKRTDTWATEVMPGDAERIGIMDQVAAVLILQAFLEARANQRGRS